MPLPCDDSLQNFCSLQVTPTFAPGEKYVNGAWHHKGVLSSEERGYMVSLLLRAVSGLCLLIHNAIPETKEPAG